MQKIMYLIMLLMTIQAATALTIDQVYYDPIETESGGEFLILRNDEGALNLEGYVIATGSSPKDVVLPAVVLGSGDTYLIADEGWNESKDDKNWPEADLEDIITLKNSDSGVALVLNGTIIDAVGWGNAPSGLYEGTTHYGVDPGQALIRINDTGDNSQDFINGTPRFKISKGGSIPVSVTVKERIAKIKEITFLVDDGKDEGIQLLPAPGKTRNVNLRVIVESTQNLTTTAYLSELSTLERVRGNDTIQEFQGVVPLYHNQRPGKYNVTITADDGNDIAVDKIEVDILPLVALDIGVKELDFGAVLPGTSKRIANKSLSNIGNVELDLSYEGTDLKSGPFKLNISAIKFSVDKDFAPEKTREITPSNNILGQSIDTTLPLGFEINIPEDAIGGTYTGTITFTGIRK